jgi:AcrR family transcriptional regulator
MPRSRQMSEQMRAQSQTRILAAARKLFAANGFFNTKVGDLARQAGMSQGNLYWYFPTKEDVLKAVLAEGFTALHGVTAQAAGFEGSGRDKVDFLIERMWDLTQTQTEFCAVLLSVMGHGGAPFMAELGFDMGAIGLGFHENLDRVFGEARDEGSIGDVDPDHLVMFFYALFNGLLITYADRVPTLPYAVVRGAVLRLVGATWE